MKGTNLWAFAEAKKYAVPFGVHTYTSLLGFQIKPKPLTIVYRTPKEIFELSLSLIKDGFKGQQYDQLLGKLSFKNSGGRFEIVSELEVDMIWQKSLSKFLSDEFMFITDTESKDHRKTHNHLNCRGCEGSIVFIGLSPTFLENPNYLYTLMCRTREQLILVMRSEGDRKRLRELFAGYESGLKYSA